MTVRHYHSTDTGSPGVNLTGRNINRLRQILRACLVDGYGSKPGAGWSMVHEHENGFSLTNGTRSGIINFVQASSWENPDELIQVYLLEEVHEKTSALLVGENLRSGRWYPGVVGEERHTINAYWPLYQMLDSAVWGVVADERSCIFTVVCSVGGITSLNAYGSISLYFGEIDSSLGLSGPATFIACGGNIAMRNYSSLRGGTLGGGYTALRNLRTGFVPDDFESCISLEISAGYGVETPPINIEPPQLMPKELILHPLYVYSSEGGVVGKFRGCLGESFLKQFGLKTSLRAVGASLELASAGKLHDVSGIELAAFGNAHYQFFATTHPDFW